MLKTTLRLSGFLLLALLLLLPASQAHAASSAGMTLTPLANLLQPDGSLDLNTGFSGSLDASGWKMETATGGAPSFGPSEVTALAVKGNDLYVGGDFTTAGGKPSLYLAQRMGP